VAGRGASSSKRKWCIEAQGADWKTGVGSDILSVSLIAWAIAEGRKMAVGINQYLQAGKSLEQSVK